VFGISLKRIKKKKKSNIHIPEKLKLVTLSCNSIELIWLHQVLIKIPEPNQHPFPFAREVKVALNQTNRI
jgi:hypothetical protein